MKPNYKPLPAIAVDDVTLLLGSSIGSNVDASLSHAKELVRAQASGSVLYINTAQNSRSMYHSARKHGMPPNEDYNLFYVDGDTRKVIYLMNIIRGELYKWRDHIKEYLREGYIQYIVINSWEYAGKNSRYREEAIFLLRELTDGMEGGHPPMHVLVYAEEPSSRPEVQKLHRGGFGKLAGIAKKVECIAIKEKFKKKNAAEIEMEEAFAEVSAGYSGTDSQSVSEENLARGLRVRATEEDNLNPQEIIVDDPRIGTEDEPGIDSDEALRRFLARVKPAAEKKWKESGMPMMTVRESVDQPGEISSEEKSEVRSPKSEVGEERTSADVHLVPVMLPTSDIGRRTSDIPPMPIHLNNYSDKKPERNTIRPSANTPIRQTARVQSDIIQK